MPQKKLKSKQYLEFSADKRCVVTGRKPTEMHHEGIFPGYAGSGKKNNDFQVINLTQEKHTGSTGVHSLGEDFWETNGLDKYRIVLKNLTEYRDTVSDRKFKSFEEYESEMSIVQEYIDWLEEYLEEEDR